MNSNVDDLKRREKDIYKDITKYFQKELDDYNLDADNSLRQDFSSSEYNLGFIQQIGRYTDKITNVTSDEPSYLVPFHSQLYTWDEFLNKMIKLMFKYYQQCILLCQPNNNGTYDVGFKSNCVQHIQERLYYKNTKQIFV